MVMVVGDTRPALTLNAWVPKVLEMRERARYRNVKSERVLWRVHIEGDALGQMALEDIASADVDAFWRRLATRKTTVPRHYKLAPIAWVRPLSHSTMRNVMCVLRACFRQAVVDGLLIKDPAQGVTIPRPLKATTELVLAGVLEAEEERAVLRILEEGDPIIYAMVRFALGTGVRRGEMLSLRWRDVVLRERDPFVWVRDSGRGSVDEMAPTKGGAPRRVPLFGMALDALRELSRRNKCRAAFPAEQEQGELFPLHTASRWVFPGPAGGRRGLPPTRELREALRAVGVTRSVRWHDLRHTCATALLEGTREGIERPWSVQAVKQLLGHASVTTTEGYVHDRDAVVFAAARASVVAAHVADPVVFGEPAKVGFRERFAADDAIGRGGNDTGLVASAAELFAGKCSSRAEGAGGHAIAPSTRLEGKSRTEKPPGPTRFLDPGAQVTDGQRPFGHERGPSVRRTGEDPLARTAESGVGGLETNVGDRSKVVKEMSADTGGSTRVWHPDQTHTKNYTEHKVGASHGHGRSMRPGEIRSALVDAFRGRAFVLVFYEDAAGGECMSAGMVEHLDSRYVKIRAGKGATEQSIPLDAIAAVEERRREPPTEGGTP